ncbi:holo-ACP synthase [Phenylobacterium sp.]|uniref:holo-ACP synthase n=1 Tax=Phenylobacterium sp. TaxID=1871053 RepID=UPI0011F8FE86|nr:4'-phosphopantetheinyl transferase superfamily protein [Phenylobacterium sp.]THD61606.1 MAG: 4'-phosphopantetheinyl transferase superfamily protein [Phenylobacterium sp.]
MSENQTSSVRFLFPPGAKIIGVGTDVVVVDRMREAIERTGQPFLNRLFSATEQLWACEQNDSAIAFSSLFAAKEAVAKSIGTGITGVVAWHDLLVDVVADKVALSGGASKRARRLSQGKECDCRLQTQIGSDFVSVTAITAEVEASRTRA